MPDISEQSFKNQDENRKTACQILEARLLDHESDGRVFVAADALSAQNLQGITELQQNLAEQGVTLLVIDAATKPGSRGHLYDTIQAFLTTLESRRQLGAKSQELFEFLNVSLPESLHRKVTGSWNDLYRDALSRLWVSLAQQNRVSLLILNADQLADLDREQIRHVMRFFYTDPIRALLPETQAWDRAPGAIVLAGSGCESLVADGIEHEILKLSNESEQAVRQFLAREDIVQRFVRTIGGDPARLDELVSAIPEGVEQFWMHRFLRLESAGQRLVEILACAQGWLGADRLHDAATQLGVAEHFARHLNALIQSGFVCRKVGSGQVLLSLEHQGLAASLESEIDESHRREVHLALAHAELGCNPHSPCVATLARHFLAAGLADKSVQYGLLAARQFVQRCEFETASAALDPLLQLDCSSEQRTEIHAQLAEINTTLGNYRKALLHYDYLKNDLADASERIDWLCKTGNLLVLVGQAQNSIEIFQQAEGLLAESENFALEATDILLGKGEACYALGDSKGAARWAHEASAKIHALENDFAGENARADGNLIRARNLLGKIAIFEANYTGATEYFQQNDQLATAWGWEREVARAQANLGVVQLQLRNYGEALERLTRALELSRIPGSLPRAYCLLNLGIVHQRQAHFELALSHYLEALRAARRSGDTVAYSISAHNLATLYQDMGAFDRAWKILEHLEAKTLAASSEQNSQPAGQHVFVNRWTALLHGNLLLEQERFVEALDAFAEIAQLDAGLSDIVYGSEAKLRLVEVNLELGNLPQAEALLAVLEESEKTVDEPQLQALTTLYKSRLALHNNSLEQALELGKSASAELTKLGMFRDALQAERVVADVYIQTNLRERAHVRLQQAIQSIRLRAEQIPTDLRANFYGLGAHRKLIEQFQRINGEVPAEFLASVATRNVSPAEEVIEIAPRPVRDAAFEKWRAGYEKIVGESARLHQIFRFVDRVASSDTIVLLTGESGTGKELIAEALHERSDRAKKTFVRVNCAAFVESLLLSELFGHEKGAFTGAQSARAGRFELADGGTLFLDEIGDISPNTQVALLRVLQEGTFERVGGTETRRVNVRVICATNKNLDEMVKRGEFRLDLYYRLKGLVLEMPALRERREDIPRLLNHFAEIHCQSGRVRRFSPDVMRFLCAYSWTGNIRELENFVKSILLFVEGDTVEMSHIEEFREFFADGEVNLELPEIAYEYDYGEITSQTDSVDAADSNQASWLNALDPEVDAEEALVEHIVAQGLSLTKLKKRLELECIKRALEETDGNITRAADLLQMKRPRLSQIINSSPELLNYKAELVG